MTAGKYVICIPERGIKTSTPPLTFGPSRRPEVSGWGEAGVRRAAGGEKKKHNWILMRCSRFRAGWSEQSSAANFLFRSLTDFWDKKKSVKKKKTAKVSEATTSAQIVLTLSGLPALSCLLPCRQWAWRGPSGKWLHLSFSKPWLLTSLSLSSSPA